MEDTQQSDVLDVLFEYTASSVTPLLLLESFAMGAFCVCAPLASYVLWIKLRSTTRSSFILGIWTVLAMFITHWALSLRQLINITTGRSFQAIGSPSQTTYDILWSLLLPLVTETVLFGCASVLFAIVACATIRKLRSEKPSRVAAIIPAVATIMYTVSLIHWAIFILCYAQFAIFLAPTHGHEVMYAPKIALAVLLPVNAFLSDSIVLWRGCIVWNRTRWVLAFSVALLATTLGLNITNLVSTTRYLSPLIHTGKTTSLEAIPMYGESSTGFAAVFLSLACNLSATMLVGLKAWIHRRLLAEFVSSKARSGTLVSRVLELLAESGIVYTLLWTLYCVSFFKPLNETHELDLLGPGILADVSGKITTVDHLNVAMAQITTIYPLIIFVLLALDKIHYERGPQALSPPGSLGSKRNNTIVTIDLDVDIERGAASQPLGSSGKADQMVLHHRDGSPVFEMDTNQ